MGGIDRATRRSLPGPAAEGEPRGGGFRAIGVAAAKLAAPVLAKRAGRHLGRLKAAWPAIAGADWAASAWPRRLGRDGVLRLHVRPAAALELQHRAPLLIERINLYLGSAVVTRLVLEQAIPPPATVGAMLPTPPLPAAEAARLERLLAQVADPELRAALAGLGRAILAATPATADIAPDGEID